ncbi:hypothetical protein Ahy_B02g057953 [Arachis hypogaea]|uniref:Aminotransferase-like plant mobile domain-containing protein n=1 Tax=Arachis hypogaea TaxID=3818 RepID=A0A445ADE3_ARAHY|nr:hypothetical protein Ahy_B02g057953 [Arachis hypogaea]
MAGLYHRVRLNETWFRLDEPLVSAFVERWRPKTHTFHMPFGECTITLQDVAYQLGIPIDGHYVSGCLTDFKRYIEGGCPVWAWFEKLLDVLLPVNCIDKFVVIFRELLDGADEAIVRRYARAYIMMLLGTQLFGDKSDTRIHIRWLLYVARLENMGGYSWESAALNVVKLAGPLQLLQTWIFWRFSEFRLGGYDMFGWPLASRWSGHNPTASEKGPRIASWRLRIDLLQFIWMPYSSHDVVQVVHPEILILEPRHMVLWKSVTAVTPGRSGATVIWWSTVSTTNRTRHWFLDFWHLHWDNRVDHHHVIRFDVVPDPSPSCQYNGTY